MKKIIRRLICLVGVLCLLFSSLTIYAETGEENVADFMSCHQTALMNCL